VSKLLEFINKRTARKIEYKESFVNLLLVLVALFSGIAIFYVLYTKLP